MKIIEVSLIVALIITFTLSGAFLNQVLPTQNLLVLPSLPKAAVALDQPETTAKPAASHVVSINDVPGAQVVVGVFCLVFGTITFLPLLVKNEHAD